MTQPIEILCIGNEILIGKTLNTNAQWLAKRATILGLGVRRITTIRDDVNEISNTVREGIFRKPSFIITIGGLGPTFDDKTMKGLAEGLECPLAINNEALKMVKDKYKEFAKTGKLEDGYKMTSHRVKMARLPKGAKPLFNPLGTAPGVIVDKEDTTIIALPGVPSEMKAIFESAVASLLKQVAGNVTYFETTIETIGVGESQVAPLIDQVMYDNPLVYIKSHPKTERLHRIEFHFSTTTENFAIAKKIITKALVQLSELIEKKGGKIRPIKSGLLC
jgi:molybdenum cofactor synthesis domain-containing protein